MRIAVIAVALAGLGLAGCQTPGESLVSAEDICAQQGFRPGSRSFRQCVNVNYVENRRAAQDASNAVAAGVAAGVVGGAIVAASTPRYGYGYGYGYGYYGRAYRPYRPYGRYYY